MTSAHSTPLSRTTPGCTSRPAVTLPAVRCPGRGLGKARAAQGASTAHGWPREPGGRRAPRATPRRAAPPHRPRRWRAQARLPGPWGAEMAVGRGGAPAWGRHRQLRRAGPCWALRAARQATDTYDDEVWVERCKLSAPREHLTVGPDFTHSTQRNMEGHPGFK